MAASPALDFSCFHRASKLATHAIKENHPTGWFSFSRLPGAYGRAKRLYFRHFVHFVACFVVAPAKMWAFFRASSCISLGAVLYCEHRCGYAPEHPWVFTFFPPQRMTGLVRENTDKGVYAQWKIAKQQNAHC